MEQLSAILEVGLRNIAKAIRESSDAGLVNHFEHDNGVDNSIINGAKSQTTTPPVPAPPVPAPPAADVPTPPAADVPTPPVASTSAERISIEDMAKDYRLIPAIEDRPFPETPLKRKSPKQATWERTLEAEGEYSEATVAAFLEHAKAVLVKRKRNLKRITNIDASDSVESANKAYALSIATLEIDMWENSIEAGRLLESAHDVAVATADVPQTTTPPVTTPPVTTPPVTTPPVTTPPVAVPPAPAPVPTPPVPVIDSRDLPAGYAFVNGTEDDISFARYTASGWKIEQMLQQNLIYVVDVALTPPTLIEVTSITTVEGLNEFISKQTANPHKDLDSIMQTIAKYGVTVDLIPIEHYPSLIADIQAL